MDAQRKEALGWFVDFANMDLETISPGDRAKLLVESEEHLFPGREIKEFADIKEELRKEIPWAFNQPLKESSEYWNLLITLQRSINNQVFMGTAEPPRPTNGVQILPWSTAFIRGKIIIQMKRGEGKEPFRLSRIPLFPSQGQYIWFEIDGLLDGLPSHTIQTCSGCKKYFLNPTARKKEFCSPRCLWRVKAEKKRKDLKEKHPRKYKAYLKKQQERMSRKYEEERKAKLGPNVKIGKRKIA